MLAKQQEKKWEAKREQLKKFLDLLFLSEEQRQKCKRDQTNGKHIEMKQKGCQLSSKLHSAFRDHNSDFHSSGIF